MRRPLVLVVPVLLASLAGCGAAATGASPTVGQSAAPTAACPQQPGVELPADCAGYDPDQAMAANDLYRQRAELTPDVVEAATTSIESTRASLEQLRVSGTFTEADVRAALEVAGLSSVQTRAAAGDVLFGAVVPSGGCLYGAVEEEAVTVDVGGFIMDGGCLPAQ